MSNEPIDGDIWIRQNQKYMPVGPRNTYKNIHLLDHPTLGTPPMQRRPSLWWLEGVPSPYIGKVESLEEDLQRIAKALKFPYRRPRRANATRVRPVDYREMYDSESIEFVRHYHKLDIEAGNYGFT